MIYISKTSNMKSCYVVCSSSTVLWDSGSDNNLFPFSCSASSSFIQPIQISKNYKLMTSMKPASHFRWRWIWTHHNTTIHSHTEIARKLVWIEKKNCFFIDFKKFYFINDFAGFMDVISLWFLEIWTSWINKEDAEQEKGKKILSVKWHFFSNQTIEIYKKEDLIVV